MSSGASEPADITGAKVFITYRREETAPHAGRLYDAMAARFGEDNVFMDVDMAPGVDFVQRITEAVAGCQVLIVVMGPEWATVQDEQGTARLANPEDFVRLEVETALKRPEVTPIPVLVSGARMPRREDLPAEVGAITRRNALELSDHRWRNDVGRLMGTLDELLGEAPAVPAQPSRERKTEPPSTGRRRLWWAVLPVLAIVAIAIAVVAASGGGGHEDQDEIASVVEAASTSTDPADCTELQTQRFLDQTQFRGSGPEAVERCSAGARNTGEDPDSV